MTDAVRWIGATLTTFRWGLFFPLAIVTGLSVYFGPTVGIAVGLIVAYSRIPIHVAIGSAVVGLIVGGAQWVVLLQHIRKAERWVMVSAAGFCVSISTIGAALYSTYIIDFYSIGGGATFGAFIGAFAGWMQWLIVLRHQYSHTGWWVLLSTISWAVGGALMFGTDANRDAAALHTAIAVGMIESASLAWLLRQPAQVRAQSD